VSQINSSKHTIKQDSVIMDRLDMGIKSTNFITIMFNGDEIVQYIMSAHTIRSENGVEIKMNSSSAFYFEENKLIMVEEHLTENGKSGEAKWYYDGEKPIYYTLNNEGSADRADFLLLLSKTILKQLTK
jgi:hypothetical protein